METYKGAETFIDVLNAYGVEYIFFNPGIDTVPVQVTVSRLKKNGKKAPGLVLCLDESVAMAAAYGHYGISGKPQVVLVHRELGTLQVGGQMHNAYFGRVPVMLCAGSLAPTNRLNWTQQPYSSCSMTRNCVKWDHEMSPGEEISTIASQALAIASTDPKAPVYLATSWEAYAGSDGDFKPAMKISSSPKQLDAASIEQAADILLNARSPLIIAGNSGRHPESVASLVELAETLGARTLNGTVRVSFPTAHPLCTGVDPIGVGTRNASHYIPEADVILLIDYDLPYAPRIIAPGLAAKIVNIDTDPVKKVAPLWNRAADIFIEADSSLSIPALTEAIRQKITPEQKVQIRDRAGQIENEHHNLIVEREAYARSKASQVPISSDWVCYCLSQVVEEDSVIVNQSITQSASAFEQIYRSLPGTWLGCAGGSIGWALGAALGVKMAAPGKTVVALTGDGGFIWGCPEAALWSAGSYRAPFLTIIFNNQAYGAIKGLVGRAYGEENVSPDLAFDTGVGIAPPPDYALIAQACGAYGKTVKEPDDVLPSLQEAIKQVHSGRAAVLDMRMA